MKKMITAVLAVSMLAAMSTSVMAADVNQDTPAPQQGNTSITFEVKPTYTVTIPATVALTEQPDKSYAGSGIITTAAVRLNKKSTIDVTIASDFELATAQGATQSYVATIDGDTTALVTGSTIAQFDTAETAQSVKLNYAAANPQYAGEYSDTVTFTIGINTNIA